MIKEDILKLVEQKELEKEFFNRCISALICPNCGGDLVVHDDYWRKKAAAENIIMYRCYSGAYLCLPCHELFYPQDHRSIRSAGSSGSHRSDDAINMATDVWGGAGPDCIPMPE